MVEISSSDRRDFLRYTRTNRWPILERFPVGEDVHAELLAHMLSCTPEVIAALTDSLEEETRAAAAHLLTDEAYRDALTALPFGSDDRVVAVGDSITADRLGWFELLAASFGSLGKPGPTLINLGVSGNTTADVIERFDLLEAARPTRVLLMLGTNDARAHGRAGHHRMATTHETERNLRALLDLVTGDLHSEVTVITPPAVDQPRVDEFFADAPVRWSAAAVAEIAAVVRKVAPEAVDVHDATRGLPADLLEADGVHPTAAGQRFILARILDHLGPR